MTAVITKWLIVSLIIAGTILAITNVGKPREPLSGTVAALTTIINTAIVVAILAFWQD